MRFNSIMILRAFLFLATWVVLAGPSSQAAGGEQLDWLPEAGSSGSDSIEVLVFIEDDQLQIAVRQASSQPRLSRSARIKQVSHRLRSFRSAAEQEIGNFLRQHSQTPVTRLWIAPAYLATLTADQIRLLADMPGIKQVAMNVAVEMIQPVESREAPLGAASSSSHAQMLNVPALWNMGYRGEGRLVASFDTGVEQTHPALSHNWRGNHTSISAAWMSTITPNSLPTDAADHGTHTMGTMVGIDGADTIGVAPAAEWITAGVIDQGKGLTATFADILLAFQWSLNPDGDPETTDDVPDVILNSWGVPPSIIGPCDNTFFSAIDNVEAAGIVTIFSAGNEGPNPSTLRNPASRASSPLNAFAIGAVDNSRLVASFSSRGPGGCSLNAIKPEVVAPGVSVRSASSAGGYRLQSGTSMAAPLIAGLVALCRQYNPNSTVEEIKWALINSAKDLGPTGEDNAYGYGLVDASRLFEFLPSPVAPQFDLDGMAVSGDGTASPGELFDLEITLELSVGQVDDLVVGQLNSLSGGVTITSDSSGFSMAAGNDPAWGPGMFRILFDSSLINGTEVALELQLLGVSGEEYGLLSIVLPVGFAPHGSQADHATGSLQLTVSDYAQYGLAQGSIYNVGGQGFRFQESDNLLFEAGMIMGRSEVQLSSSTRGAGGEFEPSDFVPLNELSADWQDAGGAVHRTARMADQYSQVPVPVVVSQESIDYSVNGDSDFIIFKYYLINQSLTTLRDFYFGFMTDFDIALGGEVAGCDPALKLAYQCTEGGLAVGLVGLIGLESAQWFDNDGAKTGLTREQKYLAISTQPGWTAEEHLAQDRYVIISGGPFTINPFDSVEVAVAMVAASNLPQLRENAVSARAIYGSPTSLDEPPAELPTGFVLNQNYPNPFNPATTISFTLPASSNAVLEVFNLLGQSVRRFSPGVLPGGAHTIEWDGTDHSGSETASGVYFYRLTAGRYEQTKKMILLR